ncbi:hypothetical protein HHX47_DHR10000233 [Lentinula edodes]|nr:hypothetical protein HHX47_DHR10000233 [Lentinula edodes]
MSMILTVLCDFSNSFSKPDRGRPRWSSKRALSSLGPENVLDKYPAINTW